MVFRFSAVIAACVSISACVPDLKSDFLDAEAIIEFAEAGGGTLESKSFLNNEVHVVCEFWPYSESKDFRDSPFYHHLIGSKMFPVDENEWAILYIDHEGLALGFEKYRRFRGKIRWKNSELNPRNNCSEASNLELYVEPTDTHTNVRLVHIETSLNSVEE